MLAAGLKGIEDGLEPPDPIEENVYEMTEKQREAKGIRTLPANLADAIALTEKSALVKEALGDHVFNAFIENKKIEWNQYRIHVSKYELDRYLPML
jgi:glutamine synthetase